MEFKYEMHLHAAECSKCSPIPAQQMVQALAQKGYAGGVLTDHFLGGNTAVPRDLPWAQKMHLFYGAYESALQEAKRLDLDLFFGIEHAIPGTGKEFLTYGIDLEFLLANPDMMEIPIEEYIRRVHAVGGLVVQAHPFRQASYILPHNIVAPALLDGVEVYNAGNARVNQRLQNRQAAEMALQYDLIPVVGSDAHHPNHLTGCGMVFDHRLKTVKHLLRALRNKEGKLATPDIV